MSASTTLDQLAVATQQELHHPTESPSALGEATRWYFAYGSNLDGDVFLRRRGIHPIRHKRLKVPGWRLNFEIAGLPYREPGFGSIRPLDTEDAQDPAVINQPDLQGVAYLVTEPDYQHIIATEGGAGNESGYAQIQLDAHSMDNQVETLRVWTLQAKRPRRRCQPSERYVGLILSGAKQHGFDEKYIAYLRDVQTYRLQGWWQTFGALIFSAFWLPVVTLLFTLRAKLTDQKGNSPRWLGQLMGIVFSAVWTMHDTVWSPVFGRGDYSETA
ncbi:hypothetical protein PYCC9005_003947 [Savitreella phatthalungensis]